MCADWARAERVIAWKPTVTLPEGIRKTIASNEDPERRLDSQEGPLGPLLRRIGYRWYIPGEGAWHEGSVFEVLVVVAAVG